MPLLPTPLEIISEPLPPTPSPKRRGGARQAFPFCSPSPLRGGGRGEGFLKQAFRQAPRRTDGLQGCSRPGSPPRSIPASGLTLRPFPVGPCVSCTLQR